MISWLINKFRRWSDRIVSRSYVDAGNPADRLPDDPIRNGIHAAQLLDDPLLKACFEQVRQTYLRKFESTPIGDMESLKTVQLSLAALADVRRAMLVFRFNGQTALAQHDQKNPNNSGSFRRPEPKRRQAATAP